MLGQIYRATRIRDFHSLRMAAKKMLYETRGMPFSTRIPAFEALLALSDCNHAAVRDRSRILVYQKKYPLGHYYLAQSHFLCGEYTECLDEVLKFLDFYPYHPDATYLKVYALTRTGNKEQAWLAIENLVSYSRWIKSWSVMANLVETTSDFSRLVCQHELAKKTGLVVKLNPKISEYLALGALRCGEYTTARNIWREMLLNRLESPDVFLKAPIKVNNFNVRSAARALSDLVGVLRAKNIEMFLVSGTLLGCIRENRILGHDKDLDVGIWEETPRQDLLKILECCGLFYILPSRALEIIRLQHLNGISIDVFYHYREGNTYWHGGVKIKWHNKPFRLMPYNFLNDQYLIPENYDVYLTENYGDWRIPKKAFDSAYDTNNAEIINGDEMVIHAFKGLLKSPCSTRMRDHLECLNNFGEMEFVSKFDSMLKKMP